MALKLRHQTAGEFAVRFWNAVQRAQGDGDKIEFSRLMYWIERKLVAGDITDAEVSKGFNAVFERAINATQWTQARTDRVKEAHGRYAAMLAEVNL